MPISDKITYGYKDLGILTAEISYVKSRSECHPYYPSDGNCTPYLPIFASPMTSVVSGKNFSTFHVNGIDTVIPRDKYNPLDDRMALMKQGLWVAVSLDELNSLFCNEKKTWLEPHKTYKICVDVANGTMANLYDTCKRAKRVSLKQNYNLTIMTGNINNPATYGWVRRLNNSFREKYKVDQLVIDYLRLNIGSGDGCITAPRTGIYCGKASLIDECNAIKQKYNGYCCPKIVADGGIKDFGDVCKALALGADYVMIGSVFARMIESAGEKTLSEFTPDFDLPSQSIDDYTDFDYNDEYDVWNAVYKVDGKRYCFGEIDVKFFGMASGDGQRSMTGKKTKNSEGVTKMLKVNFSLPKWVNIMTGCLKSAMSYCNSYTLEDFIGKQTLVVLSQNEINSLNK